MSTPITTSPPAFTWPYLERDAQGRIQIAGTRIRLAMLVQARQAHGWSPEEIHFQYPTLSLPQIYSALSYYYANQAEIDEEIATAAQTLEQLQTQLKAAGTGHTAAAFTAKLRAQATQE